MEDQPFYAFQICQAAFADLRVFGRNAIVSRDRLEVNQCLRVAGHRSVSFSQSAFEEARI